MRLCEDYMIRKNPINFDDIQIREYALERLTRNIERRIFGLDTETLGGYCKLLADSRGNYILDGDIDDYLAFLTTRRFRSAHNFFFNLNYDVNALIKFLPKDNLMELYKDTQTVYNGNKIFFIPKKLLRITKNRHVYKFYDVFQFFGTSLDKASQKYLGMDKFIEDIDRVQLGTDPEYWKPRIPEIIKYCINDALLTQKLGEVLNQTLVDAIELNPCSYISKASICKEFVRKSVDIPDITKVPRNALKYAFDSYSGGRFEIIKKGYVGKCSLYDINSAYPYHIRNLLDINKGEWKRVNSLNENADYGFYLVKLITKYGKISPIAITLKNGVICYPMVEAELYITKEELLAYEPYIEYEIVDGWEFKAETIEYPFRDYIDRIFEFKKNTEPSRYEYKLYKILMNSLYGCFYEKNVKPQPDQIIDNKLYEMPPIIYSGKLFNPIYATLITANTRIQLFDTAMPHINDVVGFATDSILFQGKPEIPTSKHLGAWGLQDCDNATVLRSGIYQIGETLKNRGIKKASKLRTPHGEFKDIFDYIRSEPDRLLYPIIMNRPLTFIEVLLHHKARKLEDINVFVDIEYNININKDHKRVWEGEFNAGIELFEKSIDSEALIMA